MTAKPAVKKKPRQPRRASGTDRPGYRVITYVYYLEGEKHFDTALADQTITEFLLELNDQFERPSIVFTAEVSKEQYAQLEGILDAVEDTDEIPIGGGYTARVLPEEVDLDDAVSDLDREEDDLDFDLGDFGDDEGGMRVVRGDPDEMDVGNPDLDRDRRGQLDDSDL